MAEPQGEVSDANALDPDALGFMCGIEVHQQLATGKLHSRQPGVLYDVTEETVPDTWPRTRRRLRAARGEGGAVDVAARFEAKRRRSFEYVQSPNAGLIELDERPPLPLDEDAVDVTLTVAALLEARPVDLMQTMRKTVVDGSNTSGFQRTTLVAQDGTLQTPEGPVGVDVICLEEDSARKLSTVDTGSGERVSYNLDRLGLPLIEIATAPDVQTPDHAQSTARALGAVLRRTRRVRRGLGSIRQDLNVSIACGDRVEIKGCQDLGWIPRIVRLEMARQLHFYRLANTLREAAGQDLLPPDRRLDDPEREARVAEAVAARFPDTLNDVSSVFASSTSGMVERGLAQGHVMLALSLPGLAGLLGTKTLDEEGAQLPRLGRELAGAAKLAGVRGVFHSDELPAYGITEAEVDGVRSTLSLAQNDAFVLCLAPDWQASLALEAVRDRALLAHHRLPREVRNVTVSKGAPLDGTTGPMRPLPGGARMYPETDVPPLPLEAERWARLSDHLPPSNEERRERLSPAGLSDDQREQILARELDDRFLEHLGERPAKAFATLMLEHEHAPTEFLVDLIDLREEGALSREGVKAATASFPEGADRTTLVAWAEAEGHVPTEVADLDGIIAGIIAERLDFVKERGFGAIGPLMGVVMGAAKGADGREVSERLKAAIQQVLS